MLMIKMIDRRALKVGATGPTSGCIKMLLMEMVVVVEMVMRIM